jgi:hypothetical protein
LSVATTNNTATDTVTACEKISQMRRMTSRRSIRGVWTRPGQGK